MTAARKHRPLSDAQILKALDLIDNEGWTMKQAGEHVGTTKNAMIGLVNRIRNLTNESDPDAVQNGTMPRGWWVRNGIS